MDDDVTAVLEALTRLIMNQLSGAGSRRYFPTPNPDDDDDTITRGKDRAARLRIMRAEFEDLASGIH